MQCTQRLIFFTRYPQPGTTKTRLIPALGAAAAAELQRQMTEHSLRQVARLQHRELVQVEIWYAAASAAERDDRLQMQDWLGNEWHYQPQGSGDLGDRMASAFQAAFAAGSERVVIMGTDCPGLDADRLAQAFQLLHCHDLVLGPALDGGYYLIGLRRFVPELFAGIAWSTDTVRQRTLEIAAELGLSIACLDTLSDIDYPEDLPVWEAVRAAQPLISVIIPTLNEAEVIAATLAALQAIPDIEVMVVDGGSQDDTIARVRQLGFPAITASGGRAAQMNAGARLAAGEILLFLHADTRLPVNFVPQVKQTLMQPDVVAGAFQLAIDAKLPGLRLVEWGVNWRSTALQLPYGDQALFLQAETFRVLGGFPELPIMEDYVFVQQLKQQGSIAIIPEAVVTSARRWQRLGVWQTTLMNQFMIAGYKLGISIDRLANWYRGQ